MDESEAISKPKSPSGKVCFVCAYAFLNFDYYAVFIVDLKSQVDDGWHSTTPTLVIDRLSLGNYHTFCVLNSTLYMIEFGCRAHGNLPREGKSVYTYDLSPAVLDADTDVSTSTKKSFILEQSMLVKDDMLCPKVSPAACATPDGKRILVFSTRFQFWSSYSVDDEIDFEVFDPVDRWKKLPSLKVECLVGVPKAPGFVIKTYGFVRNSIFLIQTDVAGMFTLDLEHLYRGWRKENTQHAGAKRIPFGGRFFEFGKWCFALSGAYSDDDREYSDDNREDTSSPFPISSFGKDFKHEFRRFCAMHLLDKVYNSRGEGEGEGLVHLQTGIDEVTRHPHMLLDVCSFNIEKHKGDKPRFSGESESARLEASIVKSFKFFLNSQCWKFFALYLSPIGARTN